MFALHDHGSTARAAVQPRFPVRGQKRQQGRPAQGPDPQTVAALYGDAAASYGFAAIPAVILTHSRMLGLDADDLEIVVRLLLERYRQRRAPAIRQADLASALGCGVRTLQRHLRRLSDLGYLQIVAQWGRDGQQENTYDVQSLINAAVRLEEAACEDRDDAVDDGDDTRGDGEERGDIHVRGGVAAATPPTKSLGEICSGMSPLPPQGDAARGTSHEGPPFYCPPPGPAPVFPAVSALKNEDDGATETDDSREENEDDDHVAEAVTSILMEIGGTRTLPSSVTRAIRIWHASGLAAEPFIVLFGRAAGITRAAAHVFDPAAYTFGTLVHLLDDAVHPPQPRRERRPRIRESQQTEAPREEVDEVASPASTTSSIDTGHADLDAVLRRLEEGMTPDNFATWFGSLHIIGCDAAVRSVTLQARDAWAADWVTRRLWHTVEAAIAAVAPGLAIDIVAPTASATSGGSDGTRCTTHPEWGGFHV